MCDAAERQVWRLVFRGGARGTGMMGARTSVAGNAWLANAPAAPRTKQQKDLRAHLGAEFKLPTAKGRDQQRRPQPLRAPPYRRARPAQSDSVKSSEARRRRVKAAKRV